MKILAIRGRNLASLAEHFCVDFEQPPLDRAGLIAITGPTGAGKTTLLDAMCLALFDRTPRFAVRGGVTIGDPDSGLKANDVRGILRHGAVEGWAEVDFLGVDEHRWRARWEVRRARGRADGKIQFQQIKLLDAITGRPLFGDRKGDVLEAIEQRLGLDFDQFRRSVLLAQGEFAAFLEANGGERAELLERMTGTGLYRQLGKAAWEQAKQAERDLQLLEREREGLRMLADDERERLRARAAELDQRRRTIEHEREQVGTVIEWHRRHARLEQDLVSAEQARAEQEQAASELEAIREALAWAERIQPLRGQHEQIVRRGAELTERQAELSFFRGELPLLEDQRAQLQARLTRDEQQLEQARERRRRIGGELDRARELDARRGELRPRSARLSDELERARVQASEREQELATLDQGLAQQRALEQSERTWLSEHAGAVQLGEAWGHLRGLLLRHARDLAARERVGSTIREHEAKQALHEREIGQLELAVHELRRQRQNFQLKIRKVAREIDQLPPLSELRARQRVLDEGQKRLATLRDLLSKDRRCVETIAELRGRQRDQGLEREHRTRERDRVASELVRVEATFAEAQRSLRQLEAVRDLASHRADLRPGEACPVCGATEHPALAREQAPADRIIAEQRDRIEALLRKRDDLQREQGEHESRRQIAIDQLVGLIKALREREREREILQVEWTSWLAFGPLLPGDERSASDPDLDTASEGQGSGDQLSLLGQSVAGSEPELPEQLADPRSDTATWALLDRFEQRARTLAQQQADLDRLVERQRDQQRRRDELDEQLDEHRRELDRLEQHHDAVTRELDRAREQLAALERELDERDATLAAVLDEAPWIDWRARLVEASEAFIAALDREASAVQQHRRALDEAREQAGALELRRVELHSTLGQRRERVAALELELGELARLLAELDEARAGLLEGRSVAEVQRQLEAAEELALRDREASKDRLIEVERSRQDRRTRIEALEEQIATLAGQLELDQQSFARALASAGFSPERLEQLLARPELGDEAWLTEQRATLRERDAALARQRAVVGERERVLAAHRETRPEMSEAQASERRATLDAELRALAGELFEVEHRLRSDAEAQARAHELGPRLGAQQQRARVWARLRDAIGDATGTRFQQFAQSLTLELLLAQANAQLRELKPRYALARVPGHDLELQLIDHDLGDEVRSIRGLSGGEKFLVSLALALALASLAAEDCRIDSLFIDEGFGTLDAQSLDIAVSTLDALQSDGRQIGVISHVPGLAERVGVEIRVEPVASGRSRVRVLGPR